MTNRNEKPLIVENLKQFVFCPRIVFYERCMPGVRPVTFAMQDGHDEHEDTRENAKRRTFTQMGLEKGEREFDLDIVDEGLNLRGKLDEVIISPQGDVIPVDYKASEKVRDGHRMQLAAYAVLLENARGVQVTRGYIYLIPLRKARKLTIGDEEKGQIRLMLKKIEQMVRQEEMPPPTTERARCVGCEFRRFCNDV
jgi:CRISPR-associated exonuclease Cas4